MKKGMFSANVGMEIQAGGGSEARGCARKQGFAGAEQTRSSAQTVSFLAWLFLAQTMLGLY